MTQVSFTENQSLQMKTDIRPQRTYETEASVRAPENSVLSADTPCLSIDRLGCERCDLVVTRWWVSTDGIEASSDAKALKIVTKVRPGRSKKPTAPRAIGTGFQSGVDTVGIVSRREWAKQRQRTRRMEGMVEKQPVPPLVLHEHADHVQVRLLDGS
jgi:hypothetical protein